MNGITAFALSDPIARLLGEWSMGLNTYSIILRIAVAVIFASVIGCERSRTHRGETYRNARLRDKREAEVVADKVIFLCYETAEERAGVFADDSREEVAHTDNYQRHVTDG